MRDKMPTPLPPDPDAQQRWQAMPKNAPSKQALPPASSGGNIRWLWWLLGISIILSIITLILRGF
jgi:hypothetical protein